MILAADIGGSKAIFGLSDLVASIPAHVCLDPLAPLVGAALLARDLAEEGPR